MNAKTMSDRTIQKKKRMIVTGEMKHFLDLVENTSQCIFLTGKAGTGKSSLLRMLLARTSKQIVGPPLPVLQLSMWAVLPCIHCFSCLLVHSFQTSTCWDTRMTLCLPINLVQKRQRFFKIWRCL